MPKREKDSAFWTDSFVQKLSMEGIHLFDYLFTNDHCNQAGLYHITLSTIAFETKIPEDRLPDLLRLLAPKIVWYEDDELIWVKNFLKRQMKNDQFRRGAAKCLLSINHNGVVQEFLDYNQTRYGIDINQYLTQYKQVFKTIPPASASVSVSNDKEGRGEEDPYFHIYTTEIGSAVTPMVAERIKDIANTYSQDEFREAVKEAVGYGKGSNFRYVEKVLETTRKQGKSPAKGKSVDDKMEGLEIER